MTSSTRCIGISSYVFWRVSAALYAGKTTTTFLFLYIDPVGPDIIIVQVRNDHFYYKSISTLGSDRLLASIGAYFSYPKSNVLVIDAGTCIKYNFTNSDNHYLGGGISPGITMKLKSLHDYTAKIPLIEFDENFNLLIGDSTQHSILSGVLNGTIAEIDGIINTYKLHYPDLICLLTGGDSEYLANRLKNSIFTHQNLVLKGLNDILNYTIEINSNK